MESITFTLESEFGFFKNAEARNGKGRHFTYNHIHRLSIMGIIGSIIGLEGYNIHRLRKKMDENVSVFPEFYEILKNMKISVIPNVSQDVFGKQFHNFTDTTGFANEDGTLMVFEQWLRKPSWDIYLLLDQSIPKHVEEKIVDFLMNGKTVYIPYIGKNDHPATIKNVRRVKLKEKKEENTIHSLFLFDQEIEEAIIDQQDDNEIDYFLYEHLPVALNDQGNYQFEKMVYTDAVVELPFFEDPKGKKNIVFY